MAEYKVLQDIEAEDKLIGPLTLRQFIYAAITLGILGIAYGVGQINPFLAIPFVIPALFFGALAAPLGGAQSSEVWLLAKIRFIVKPRKRIWSQDGLQELVTITVPKKVEKQLTDNLSKDEVKSRLNALANTLDTRGWAVKNAYSPGSYSPSSNTDNDRLLDTNDAYEAPQADQTEDVMDEANSAVAQQFEGLIQQSTQAHRDAIVQKVQKQDTNKAENRPDYWFMSSQPANKQTNYQQKTIIPGTEAKDKTPDDHGASEQEFLEKRHKEQAQESYNDYAHLKKLQPLSEQKKNSTQKPSNSEPKAQTSPEAAKQKPSNPDIMRLASNDDLNVSTIAREANRSKPNDDGEVVISLH